MSEGKYRNPCALRRTLVRIDGTKQTELCLQDKGHKGQCDDKDKQIWAPVCAATKTWDAITAFCGKQPGHEGLHDDPTRWQCTWE